MESDRKNQFFIELNKSLHLFPDSFAHYKVLPHLLNAFEFGGAGPSVLAPLLKIGKLLEENEYQRKIVPCIVRSFGSNDRATRLNLLQQVREIMCTHLLHVMLYMYKYMVYILLSKNFKC